MLVIGWRCLHHSLMKTAKLIATYGRILAISFRKSITSLRQTFKEIKRASAALTGAQAGTLHWNTLKMPRKTTKLTPMVRFPNRTDRLESR